MLVRQFGRQGRGRDTERGWRSMGSYVEGQQAYFLRRNARTSLPPHLALGPTEYSDLEMSAILDSSLKTTPPSQRHKSPSLASGYLRPSNLPGHYLDHQSSVRSTAFSEEEVPMMLHSMANDEKPIGESGHDGTGDTSLSDALFEDSVGREREQHQP
jgi:hypothetical protein